MMRGLWLWAVLVALAVSGAAAAQGSRAAANSPTQNVTEDQNQDQPIQIESATLEVQDKKKVATFSGNVVVVQGDMTMKCQSLVVFYGAEHGAGARKGVVSARPAGVSGSQRSVAPQGMHDIRKIEAHGGVTVVSKDQNASGDDGVYDPKNKTITLIGNVVVSQGKNVLRGDRVVVDTVTGDAHFESGGANQSRVRALITPSKGENGSSDTLPTGPKRAN
jgi:lipopolysaccharide export system protein LptA